MRLAGRCTCSGVERWTKPTACSESGRSFPSRRARSHSAAAQMCRSTWWVVSIHPASSTARGNVRHDTPAQGAGTRPDVNASVTVDMHEKSDEPLAREEETETP